MALSEYELAELEKLNAHKDRVLRISPRRLVPPTVVAKAGSVAQGVRSRVPAKVAEAASTVSATAGRGAAKALTRSSQLTLSPKRSIRAYVRRGHTVERVGDIRNLDLEIIDDVARFKRLDAVYAAIAAGEGAGTAAVITGGTIVAGSGAGTAPGLGAVGAAVTADAAAVLALTSRVVGHTALYYGYDPNEPAEEVFMLSVIGFGTAATASARVAAYRDLAKLTQQLVRNASWDQLNQSVVTRIIGKFAEKFTQRLTKKKLAQLAPVVGVAVSASLNYKLISDVGDAAYWAYRERFLLEKDGGSVSAYIPEIPVSDEPTDPNLVEDPIIVSEIVEAELANRED